MILGCLVCLAVACVYVFDRGASLVEDPALSGDETLGPADDGSPDQEAPTSAGARAREDRASARLPAKAERREVAEARRALRLRVVDGRGRGIAGVRVVLRKVDSVLDVVDAFGIESDGAKAGEDPRAPSATTDAEGRVEIQLSKRHWLARVNPGRVSSRDYGETRFDFAIAEEDVEREVMIARAASRLRVRILDARGKTVSGLPISVVRESELTMRERRRGRSDKLQRLPRGAEVRLGEEEEPAVRAFCLF